MPAPTLVLPARLAIRLTTPRLIAVSLVAIALLATLAAAVSLWTARSIADAAQTIGRDAEPSVALALRMEATLGDMNAAALSDALTDNGAAGGTSEQFRAAAAALSHDMIEAARNITYGEAEAGPLRNLDRWAAAYQVAVAEARTYGQGNPWLTTHRVEWASRLNRDFAAPEAAALAQANADVLEQRYAAYRATSLVLAALSVAAFAVLVAALLAVQAWLARRTRRRLNVPLAAATLVAIAAGLWFAFACLTERADLRAAKTDAYDSLSVLFQAKGAVNLLRADMSAWLLDPTGRAAAQARMAADTDALIGAGLDMAGPARALRPLDQAIEQERAGNAAAALQSTPKLGGFLGAEMANITFGPAERQPATDSIHRLIDAAALIRAIQAQEVQGAHATAPARWLSSESSPESSPEASPKGSNGAATFAALQSALDQTIAVNQSEFDRRVASALATASLMPLVTTGALLLAVVLAAAGLWQRLRDYR